MPDLPPTAPVALLVFNRPQLTERLLARVKTARPDVLLVVADGPRKGHPTDDRRCEEVRRVVERAADWNPKLLTHYASTNLGCRRRIASGLDWIFSQVEEAIVLEDDCLPDPSFFPYCTGLLAHYRHDTRIGVISGDNFQPQPFACEHSYYFSRYPHCWGWATWRRAWRFYDDTMSQWPALRDSEWLGSLFSNPLHAKYWEDLFTQVYRRDMDTWDYTWTFCCWAQSLMTVLPGVNLVTNLGVGQDATHTQDLMSNQHHLAVQSMPFPLRHPPTTVLHHDADRYTQATLYGEAKSRTLTGRIKRMIEKARRHLGRTRHKS